MERVLKDKQCVACSKNFSITDVDEKFYAKFEVPEPTHCPYCRSQRRLTFRNDRNYYARECGLCQKKIISIYSEDKPFPIYCTECFWSDKWNPLDYGRDFDFNRPFFEQFEEMRSKVPRIAIFQSRSENSEYSVHSGDNKNCYMASSLVGCEDVHYTDWGFYCKDSMDLYMCTDMELCYYCFSCEKCYSSAYLEFCENMNFSYMCFDCRGSGNLIGCVGLRNKEYMVLNQKVTPEEFEQYLHALKNNPEYRAEFVKRYEQLKLQTPRRFSMEKNCENITGNNLANARNASECYDSKNLEDVRYSQDVGNMKDCMDCTRIGTAEMLYECKAIIDLKYAKFCNLCYYSSNLEYCDNCQNSHDSFGCMSLKNNRHCILNKQYKPEEYEEMKKKIIEHMKSTGEYGEFFPVDLTVFGYNESKASDYFPLNEEEVTARGWKWKPKDIRQYQPGTYVVPNTIAEVPDTITKEILACEDCGKNYRVIPYELKFYRKLGYPLPKKCQDCRHYDRVSWQNPRQLWDRNCMKCNAAFKTTYAPERQEIIYCDPCYLASLN